METKNIVQTYLKKLNQITKSKIESLKEAKIAGEKLEQAEEALAKETRDRFLPILKNVAKRATDLAVRSAQNVNSIETVESTINELKREHLDLWKSFSALLAQHSSVRHSDSNFFQTLLHDYDLRRSYVDEIVKPRGRSSMSISNTKLALKDFADRFGVFLEKMNEYVKESYTEHGRKIDKDSPFYTLKNSRDFRDFFKVYKKYAEIKNSSEEVTSGMKAMRYDFEDVIELGAILENELIDKLGYYVMFYDDEESDFHGLTKEIFKNFNVRMRKMALTSICKSVKDKNLQDKVVGEFSVIWNKVVSREMVMMMEKEPLEIAFYILDRKSLR